MFRQHEKTFARKAGLLALAVHVLLVGALLVSFTWKAAHTVISVSDVELWSELPNNTKPMPTPPVPALPKIEPEPPLEVEPLPEPEPVVEEQPEPEVPKVDIELENKKKAEEEKKKLAEEKKKLEKKKKLAEKKKKERRERLRKLQAAAFDDEVVDENEKRLKDLQQEVGQANPGPSGPSKGEMNQYIARIQAKIQGHVNNSLCADGNPVLTIKIKMLPTGEFSSRPSVTKSSGNEACDAAVERATIASEPLPLPTDPAALAKFRDLNLIFKPNGN